MLKDVLFSLLTLILFSIKLIQEVAHKEVPVFWMTLIQLAAYLFSTIISNMWSRTAPL